MARELTGAAATVLTTWTEQQEASTAAPDAGAAVLAALLGDHPASRAALRAWLRAIPRCSGAGLHGGFAGVLAGLRLAARVDPALGPLADRTAARLAARGRWRSREVGFADYDLVSGPAGLLAVLPGAQAAREHLATLAVPEGFRIGGAARRGRGVGSSLGWRTGWRARWPCWGRAGRRIWRRGWSSTRRRTSWASCRGGPARTARGVRS
ncbi:hypothetical protein ACFWQL_24200 [Amycolatopsis thermoflava]|uniref:hypothetical protein n=1 Tax=Amycolatopsis thermoflava TaxID=84480 RepID=UPI00366A10A4